MCGEWKAWETLSTAVRTPFLVNLARNMSISVHSPARTTEPGPFSAATETVGQAVTHGVGDVSRGRPHRKHPAARRQVVQQLAHPGDQPDALLHGEDTRDASGRIFTYAMADDICRRNARRHPQPGQRTFQGEEDRIAVVRPVDKRPQFLWSVENIQETRLQIGTQRLVTLLKGFAKRRMGFEEFLGHPFVLRAVPGKQKRRACSASPVAWVSLGGGPRSGATGRPKNRSWNVDGHGSWTEVASRSLTAPQSKYEWQASPARTRSQDWLPGSPTPGPRLSRILLAPLAGTRRRTDRLVRG